MTSRTDSPTVQGGPLSVARVMDILGHLARHKQGQSLAQISAELRAPKTSLFDLLRGLEKSGYVLRTKRGVYALGPATISFAARVLGNRDLVELAHSFLEELVERTGETALLSAFAENGRLAAYLDKVESANAVRYTVPLGERRELYCTASGKALLAWSDPAWIADYLDSEPLEAFTARTIVAREPLLEELEKIRRQGYASTRDEKLVGASAVAAPVFGPDGRLLAALVVAGPSERMRASRRATAETVKDAAARLSLLLGAPGVLGGGRAV